jgi:hypothetical protein
MEVVTEVQRFYKVFAEVSGLRLRSFRGYGGCYRSSEATDVVSEVYIGDC